MQLGLWQRGLWQLGLGLVAGLVSVVGCGPNDQGAGGANSTSASAPPGTQQTEPLDNPEARTKPVAQTTASKEHEDKEVALIPRRQFFGNPRRARARISPDGSKLAFLAPLEGVLNVWVAPSDDVSAAKAVTQDTHRGIRNFFWAYTNDHVLYLNDKDGDEDFHVYSINLKTE